MSNVQADMNAQSGLNQRIKFQHPCIDRFSMYVWVISIQDKSGGRVIETIKKLLIQPTQRRPHRLETDQ